MDITCLLVHLADRMLAVIHASTFPARVWKSFFGKPDQSKTEKMLTSEVPELNSLARSSYSKTLTSPGIGSEISVSFLVPILVS